ncbi:MAG: M23 family metallopeptidase [Fibromonadaceae bacterium]|jgi:hypothetical protein|nr:M23 family metallopeptidase [Fibromonadaceae bacterium]
MQRSTLEAILDEACFFGLRGFENATVANVLPELQDDKKGLVIELENNALFKRNAFSDISAIPDFNEKKGWKIILSESGFEYPEEKEKWVNCYANISSLKRKFARIAVMLPQEKKECIADIENSCIIIFNEKDLQTAGIDDLLKLKIAEINISKTPLFIMAKYAWLPTILLCILPFFIPSKPEEHISNLRNFANDVQKYSEKGDIVHVLKGDETLTQIARFVIGKYNSLVSTESMVKEYLDSNGLSLDDKIKAGDTLRLNLPKFDNTQHNSMHPAWTFFTGLLNDSIAYITELYNLRETVDKRKHEGIDIGARRGTRILAPFSGTAWTMESERGGLMIAIVKGKDILIFMHCDQRFYLSGQSIMEGDPIASVGTSGHTTGPHVHLVTGRIVPGGERNFGTIQYNMLDPIEWYNKYFQN